MDNTSIRAFININTVSLAVSIGFHLIEPYFRRKDSRLGYYSSVLEGTTNLVKRIGAEKVKLRDVKTEVG
jgi:hypothetical protein